MIEKEKLKNQKGESDMLAREREQCVVTLSDKRLLSIDEFCTYAGIGYCSARSVAETTGALFKVGRRVLVDRAKFDRYCDENTEIAT